MRPAPRGWPEPINRALVPGVLTELVGAVEESTEADSAALYFTALTVLACMMGRASSFRIGPTDHHARFFTTLVGNTGSGRKGTATDVALSLAREIDPYFAGSCVERGLSSAEGLAYRVRDAGGEDDAGVEDKRLLVVESEFASVLKVAERSGNTLAPRLRDAWDGKSLQTLTKGGGGLKATDPHVALIGNITSDELRRTLTSTEIASGTGNRILFVAVRRGRLLPDGGSRFAWPVAIIDRLREAVAHAHRVKVLDRITSARTKWHAIYTEMAEAAEDRRGLSAELTGRWDAQQLRLALALALLDCEDCIQERHVLGARELWRYAEDSVRFIWGTATGDDVADKIVARLEEAGGAGLTREQIRDAFHRNVSSDRLALALRTLSEAGRAISVTESTGGRPRERWVLRGNAESPGNHRAETLSALPRVSAFGAELAVRGTS